MVIKGAKHWLTGTLGNLNVAGLSVRVDSDNIWSFDD